MAGLDLHGDRSRLKLRAHDRGPARYFHGRLAIREVFSDLLAEATRDKGGTTFLIQGAPGAGKTALLHVLAEQAKKLKWRVARIYPSALQDPAKMATFLGMKPRHQIRRSIEGRLPFIKAVMSSTRPDLSFVTQVLHAAARRHQGLLLIMDEAQNIEDLAVSSDMPGIKHTLNAIHNGELDRPVVLLAGGLGQTSLAFDKLGISRFRGDCMINLGRLNSDSEQSVIRDWLMKSGQAQDDVNSWVVAIGQETDGWPQHIVSFAQPGGQAIRQCGGQLTSEGLAAVLHEGRKRKEEYYYGRVEWMDVEDQYVLGAFIAWRGKGATMSMRTLVKVFNTVDRARESTAESVVEMAIAKGVLAQSRDGYTISIPSMEDWMISRFQQFGQRNPEEAKQLTDGLALALR